METNIIRNIVILLLVLITIIILIIFIAGINYKPPGPEEIQISHNMVDFQSDCLKTKVICKNDSDCSNCKDANVDIKCSKEPNDITGFCLPKKPDDKCNTKNGGKYVWTGWGDTNTMGWECFCTVPSIASSGGTCEINPNVCMYKDDDEKFKSGLDENWLEQASQKAEQSNDVFQDLCTCGVGYTKIKNITDGGKTIPQCVPNVDKSACETTEMCNKMYGKFSATTESNSPTNLSAKSKDIETEVNLSNHTKRKQLFNIIGVVIGFIIMLLVLTVIVINFLKNRKKNDFVSK